MSKECGMIKDLIPLYVDDVCSAETKARVQEHIEKCESCRTLVEKMKSQVRLPMEDSTDVKGFKKFVNKKIWTRTIIIIVVFVLVWIAANWMITTRWAEIWPKMNAEGIQSGAEVVKIDGDLYLHQKDLTGIGTIINISSYEELQQGVFKFYLGEQGLTSLSPSGKARSWMGGESYQRIGMDTEEDLVIKKVIYCHKNGAEVVTLWEEGQSIDELK